MTLDKIDPAEPLSELDGYVGRASLGGPIYAGFVVIALFFGGLGGWAALAPLESAAIAPGVVMVDTSRKTIQHLEGGIIAEILVRDGELVEQDQVLVLMDETRADASLNLLEGRYRASVAQQARLVAERDGTGEIIFPDRLLAQTGDPKTTRAIEGQRRIFAERQKALQGQTDILHQRIAQFQEEILGLRGQIESEEEQRRLIAVELEDMNKLLAKKLVPKARVLALERRAAEIKGEISLNIASIARAKQSIGEAELRIRELRTAVRNEAAADLRDVENEIFELEERLRAAQDVAERTEVRAPERGIVVDLRVHTPGGVVGPGERLMDILPVGDDLVVVAKVSPDDIDVVHVGLAAQVRMTAFAARAFIPVEGEVTRVSADQLLDEVTGLAYFEVRIVLDEVSLLSALQGAPLYPGMQAEVMIITGERTTLDYLLQPITQSIERAFRES